MDKLEELFVIGVTHLFTTEARRSLQNAKYVGELSFRDVAANIATVYANEKIGTIISFYLRTYQSWFGESLTENEFYRLVAKKFMPKQAFKSATMENFKMVFSIVNKHLLQRAFEVAVKHEKSLGDSEAAEKCFKQPILNEIGVLNGIIAKSIFQPLKGTMDDERFERLSAKYAEALKKAVQLEEDVRQLREKVAKQKNKIKDLEERLEDALTPPKEVQKTPTVFENMFDSTPAPAPAPVSPPANSLDNVNFDFGGLNF